MWLTVPALALALFLGRDTFAVMLFKRAVYAQITSDIVSELSEGLHVASCGSGTPLPDLTMAGACTAVIAGGKLLVFDVGEGALRRRRCQISISRFSSAKYFLRSYSYPSASRLGVAVLRCVSPPLI